MYLDYTYNFTGINTTLATANPGQSLSTTSDVVSTNVIDMASARKLFASSPGKGPKIVVVVSAVGGTTPQFRARFVGADNAALTTNPIILADSGVSRVLTSADLPYVVELFPSEQIDAKEFYGVIFTLAGTTPTASATANVALEGQSGGLK